MSSQVKDICAPDVRDSGVVYVDEPGRVRLGGLWLEDIARMRVLDDGYELVDYGPEDDGHHYWAEFLKRW